MIRSAPSISTTGAAGDSSGGSRAAGPPRARRAAARRARGCAPWRRRRWRSACRVPAAMGSLEIRPVHSTARPATLHQAARSGSTATSRTGSRRCIFERKQFLDRRKNPFFEHGRGGVLPRPARRPRRSGASPPRSTPTSSDFQDNRWGWFGFFECEDDPEAAAALLDRAEQWLRGAGLRPHGRAVGLHDQRRVRRADRGPRADAADPLAVDAPLLPASCSRAPAWRRRWTC